jgi:hypothetical protein
MSPFQFDHSEAFDPETIQLMTKAYQTACKRAGSAQSELVNEVIAKRIIEAVRQGQRDPGKLAAYALEALGRTDKSG